MPNEGFFGSLQQPITATIVILSFGLSYLILMDLFGVGWSISRWLRTLKEVS